MDGFVNVLKPVGATASDVVVCVKRVFNEKAGHLGTLDPGASGVLPVALGRATRLFNFLTDKVKYYRAFFTFGKTTDTLDSYGVVTQKSTVLPTLEQLRSAAAKLTGSIEQLPPAYSAITVGGVRAYKLARSGAEVQLKARPVNVHRFDLLRQISADTFVFDVECSAGTYIRSLARDVAELCGAVGYMSGLIRLRSGCFAIENAFTLDEIRKNAESCMLPVMYPLADVETCVLPDALYTDLDNGRKIPCPFEDGYRKIYCKGVFFGLGINSGGTLNLKYYLKSM
ncbi:MAG: tRNA pseudouridine(55) synthase TruB [Corallococcus sp.]|nr:tRNA pseudouridine(55) synthase TruB [Corallococcus sp.]MCM1359721.1 tRNA pseudouridine(55) synthase TruB [Corallococcus sp.]MCM1395430.1 tRNA pseudouridine(55) synthase TruB [Corallococcus sp.]